MARNINHQIPGDINNISENQAIIYLKYYKMSVQTSLNQFFILNKYMQLQLTHYKHDSCVTSYPFLQQRKKKLELDQKRIM